ncbi:hypothetical protein HPP92_000593 [Vanilla planifolia]|uniref:RING-type E3 ubiquitin transferase n=1 Tax=Vanilla planifolia TaxID=51239 RepID=A0A835S2H0_VANPL|nr:hypothetical protein HPP92_000593 [Vanilla planifolia]
MSTSVPQSSGNNDEQWLDSNRGFDSGGRIMLSAVLSLVFVAIVISVHLYTRYRRRYDGVDRYVVTAAALRSGPSPAVAVAGLAPATIAALPSFAYQGAGGGGEAECAVCLSAAEEGELMRLLPGCRHVFHVACIDMWLYSHSTCPVCRAEAKAEIKVAAQEGVKEGSSRVAFASGTSVDAGEVDLERQ